MATIEVGPYELVRKASKGVKFDKVIVAMMSDQSVSERHVDENGETTCQKWFPCVDSYHAVRKIEILKERYKKEAYTD